MGTWAQSRRWDMDSGPICGCGKSVSALVTFLCKAALFFGGAFKRFKSLGFRCHRLRHKNLHNFEKNLDQNGLLRKKLEHFEIDQPQILRSTIFENHHRNFHWKFNETDNLEIESFRK